MLPKEAALRRTMERYMKARDPVSHGIHDGIHGVLHALAMKLPCHATSRQTCRIILLSDSASKIIPPLRTAVVFFLDRFGCQTGRSENWIPFGKHTKKLLEIAIYS